MKLATLRDGSRDGLLAVVSQDHSLAHVATGRARNLQQVLDDWNFLSPQLEDLSATLNHGKARHAFSFDPRQCMAPLPRAYGWAQGADGDGGDLRYAASQAFWGPTDEARWHWPTPSATALPADGGHGAGGDSGGNSSNEAGVNAPVALQQTEQAQQDALQVRVHAGLAVLTGDIAAGATAAQALEGVRLLLLAAHWQAGPGQALQRTAFAPLAVTPDELGTDWQQGRVHATLRLRAGASMQHTLSADEARRWQRRGLGALLAHLASAGPVPAACLVGSGPLGEGLSGLTTGAELQLEALTRAGASVFGTLAQRLRVDSAPEA